MEQLQKDETGYCVVCGRDSMFRFDATIITPQLKEAWGISDRIAEAFNRKESMFCSDCGCSLRIRRLAGAMLVTFSEIQGKTFKSLTELLTDNDFLQLRIAEVNACGALHAYLSRHPNHHYSEWFDDIKSGVVHHGVQSEDLQSLSYPDNYFDVVLTSETIEHVPDPDRAWSEIHRVLKPGGWHFFTIPVVPSKKTTITRAKILDGIREDYLEPVYHGAWGDPTMFVYTDFGMDVIDSLDEVGFSTTVFHENPQDELDVAVVFRSRKREKNAIAASAGGPKMLEWTGERYLPWLEDATIGYEHLHRYAYTTQFVQNKRVLDLASGEGYGSRLLARTAESVVGLDIDANAVRHAANKYIRSNLRFKQGSITDIPIEGENIFDVIVCFEALEHIQDHNKLLSEVKRLLVKGGLFIVSTPNKWVYTDEPQYENPFHVHELYLNEFVELLEKYFKRVKVLGQRIYCNSNIWPIFPRGRSDLAEYVIERNPREFLFVEGDKRIPLYFVAIASDREEELDDSSSNLVDISNELLAQQDRAYAAARESLEASIQSQQQALVEKEGRLAKVAAEREQYEQEAVKLGSVVESQRQTLDETGRQLVQSGDEIARLHGSVTNQQLELAEKEQQLTHLRVMLDQKSSQSTEQEAALLHIYQSHGWKLLTRYYGLRNRLLPEGTARRNFFKKVFHGAVRGAKGLSLGSLGFWTFSRGIYRYLLPLPSGVKQQLKCWFFIRTKDWTQNTQAYRFWYHHQGQFLERAPEALEEPFSPLEAPALPQLINNLCLPPTPSTPSVSIIIPVHNQIEFTLRCLKSIQENPSIASAEVIVLDDASQDETQKILPRIPGIRYFRNESNLGFLRTCNRAASEARGDYLVFLNNDTEVQKHWLDKMLAVFERDERAGIVGAKLIYPNGCLQEAGSMIWSDGSAWNFGRDDDPSKPEYNYVRETDYCSGACIAIKASVFREVKGFDELYVPAYYEDVDLALKVKEKGYKILYQPAASVTHFEGRTCGTDLNSGVKTYQTVNANKFLLKWSEVLKGYCSPVGRDLIAARDRHCVGRCLFVDVWPTPDRDAGSVYTVYLMKLFQYFSYQITFFPGDTTRHIGKYTHDLQQMGVECLYEPFVTSIEKYLEVNGRRFDVVVLCRAAQAMRYVESVRNQCPGAKIIFHTVDLHFLREERAARVKDSVEDLANALQRKKDELEICNRANCTLVPSMAEQSLLAKELPNAYVECFPFALSLPGRKQTFTKRHNIAFIAGYLHEPNIDAVTYFVEQLWPHIAARLPEIQFLMVGSNMPESVSSLANDRIKAIGYVENLSELLEDCRLTVAPIRYGAGIKGKVVTSLAHGVPVVASPLAVEGMGCEHGVHLLVADTIAEWTESVARVYTNADLWEYLSDNGLALMRETYSLEAGLPRLQALLHRLECPFPSEADNVVQCSTSNVDGEISVIENLTSLKVSHDPLNAGVDQVRAIAFYLPQYHPIPENDKWWGKGFTEWTYVTRARPLFQGHYQPHLPSELGFYDLRLDEVREAQADLAREYGIYGFCYHYYWFGGKRLLERPLTSMVASGRPDFPFCISWANENWTRRWDGREQEILLKQEYSPEGDRNFIRELLPVLSDRRYIRINGKPLLLVYRTEKLPNPKQTAETWREESTKAGVGDLYLCRVESFTAEDPKTIDFDAACQFPPLFMISPELDPVLVFEGTDSSSFKGKMLNYEGLARQALISKVDYKRFLGVTPSWDNSPRRGANAYMWLNSSPAAYEEWLAQAVGNTSFLYRGEERLVFINAWNEWGESCHLEPDAMYGRAYLEATRRALVKSAGAYRETIANTALRVTDSEQGLEIVFVSHDAANAGAQRLLITLIEWLRDTKQVRAKIILRHGGSLAAQFCRLGAVLDMDSLASLDAGEVGDRLRHFCGNASSLVYINTLVPGDVAGQLVGLRVPIITHVHELENAIKRWCVNEDLETLFQCTNHFIAASPPVARNLESAHGISPEKMTTIYEYIECQKQDVIGLNKVVIRKQKGLPESGFIVFGCGTTDWRKGPDLFIEVASQADRLGIEEYYFLWIGANTGEQEHLETKIRQLNLENRVKFLGEVPDTRRYFAAGDVFLLTSREDPFPVVCLEAADSGLPIVCFDGAGGMPDFIQDDAGYVVPFENTKAMAEKLIVLSNDPKERARRGAVACQRVRARHDISIAGEEIFKIIDRFGVTKNNPISTDKASRPRVSVIVPNYNHARYLRERLDSIMNQTFRDFEVIVLDDASTDDSKEVIQTYAHIPAMRVLFNKTRSGTAFKQWKKGLEEARGEYIWFAESDDYASPHFLERLVSILDSDKSIGLAYSQSYLVDPEGEILGDALQWTDDLDPQRWRGDFVNDGKSEVKNYLSQKNTIPNASAVLIRATALESIKDVDDSYGLCGDWLLWIKLLLHFKVAYVVEKLNYWRQHSSNSRSYPPGILEWQEGQRILGYLAQELGLSESEREKILLDFRARCSEWTNNSRSLGSD